MTKIKAENSWPTAITGPVRIGISQCLLGDHVRYDGGHKRDALLADTLSRQVEWVPVCPEVEAGLGVPREPMRLEGTTKSPRLVTITTGVDHTAAMHQFSARRLRELGRLDLSGYVFKASSPSCGIGRVPLVNTQGVEPPEGVGLFAQAFMEHFPLIPVEDEDRLHDPQILRDFLQRVSDYRKLRDRAYPVPSMLSPSLVILGTGYAGRVLYRQAVASGRIVLAASRAPETNLQDIPPEQRLRFDLDRAETWAALPADVDAVWTFPAVPADTVRAFGEQVAGRLRRLIVLGATSAYDKAPQASNGEWIDESCPVDHAAPRVHGEEFLRERCGAIILRLAGIYGPGRNPLDWIRQGRVGYSHRFVNLIHVEDIASIILRTLEDGMPGQTYNVSDGTPRRWAEIMDIAAARWGTGKPLPADPTPGKRISNRKLQAELGYTLRFPDLFAALEELERQQ